eukprot:CFRG7209T1
MTGIPNDCPGCNRDILNNNIDESMRTEGDDPTTHVFEGVIEAGRMKALKSKKAQQSFFKSRHILLSKFRERDEVEQNLVDTNTTSTTMSVLWNRPLFCPLRLPVFIMLTDRTKSANNFILSKFVKSSTLGGIQLHALSCNNLKTLAKYMKANNMKSVTLLVGYGDALKVKVDPPMPTKKWITTVEQWQADGFDCVQYNSEGFQSLIFWEPFPLLATLRVTVSIDEVLQVAFRPNVSSIPTLDANPRFIQFTMPKDKHVEPGSSEWTGVESKRRDISKTENSQRKTDIQSFLLGTKAEGFTFALDWDFTTLGGVEGAVFPASVERDLFGKLSFLNRRDDIDPFVGFNLLRTQSQLHPTSPKPIIIDLLFALEEDVLDNTDEAIRYLEMFLNGIRMKSRIDAAIINVHPWVLIAISRIYPHERNSCLRAFFDLYPTSAAHRVFSAEEMTFINSLRRSNSSEQPTKDTLSVSANASKLWDDLKTQFPKECVSKAMDELLGLTGLRKVKMEAVRLFKSAIQLQRMSPDARAQNVVSLNYCFLGNPGTGKTTVARLFATILHDSQMRKKNVFIESTSQKCKDDGIDEFRKRTEAAMDGVLFIDEAYDLDPGADYKGKPIVSEILSLCEDHRDRISLILAGYEDDMNAKFFSYNTGLKSRFKEVLFEDFDENELTTIWQQQMSNRHFREDNPKITSIVIGRVSKMIGRKGFGNAREIRKRLEHATTAAMSREDFNPTDLVLHFVDVIGEDPRSNPKLQGVIENINKMIGWSKIKKAVESLVNLCGCNYERELEGEQPLPVIMNRMFLGNPGTGKTTCAKLYGQVLKHLGFLSIGDVVSTTSADFMGSVVGESQKKTTTIIEGARGKVLLIDEAYNLDDSLYGKQVLDTLVEKVQGSETDDIAVLLLGYEENMLKLLRNQNPGLSRRFPKDYAFYFDDYSDKELLNILRDDCRRRNVGAPRDFQEKAIKVLGRQRRQSNFGNAGAVKLLVQNALQQAVSRQQTKGLYDGHLGLLAEDIADASSANSDKDPLAALDGLYRMSCIKSKLETLRDAHIVAQREGSELPELGHFVFTGSPGTGKTTVARVMANIFHSLGLTGTNTLVETSGLNLTGEYIGQTKIKVEEQLKMAKGGVLFIDEAYELGKGQYGTEACTSIVAAMTSPVYKDVVIIIAGYPADIDEMLNTNAGLKSRFTHFFEFPDWTADDCMSFLKSKMGNQNFSTTQDVEDAIREGITNLLKLPGWGNGRDVAKIWKEIQRSRASRVVIEQEVQKTITSRDVLDVIRGLCESRTPSIAQSMTHNQNQWTKSQPQFVQDSINAQSKVNEMKVQQNTMDAETVRTTTKTDIDNPIRDDGVSDSDWTDLQESKLEYNRQIEQLGIAVLQQEKKIQEDEAARQAYEAELNRIREETALAEAERIRAIEVARKNEEERQAREREETKRREKEIRRLREEHEKKEAIRHRLNQLSRCPQGFNWYRKGNGWTCGGGSHSVSDEVLQKYFMV